MLRRLHIVFAGAGVQVFEQPYLSDADAREYWKLDRTGWHLTADAFFVGFALRA